MITATLQEKKRIEFSWPAIRTMQWFVPHVLFAVLLALIFTPGADDATPKGPFLAVLAIGEAALLLRRDSRPLSDVMTILFLLFIVWEFGTTKADDVNLILYPSPAKVFDVFATDWQKILDGIRSSMYLLGVGFTAALTLGVLLGIVTGSAARLRDSLLPLARLSARSRRSSTPRMRWPCCRPSRSLRYSSSSAVFSGRSISRQR